MIFGIWNITANQSLAFMTRKPKIGKLSSIHFWSQKSGVCYLMGAWDVTSHSKFIKFWLMLLLYTFFTERTTPPSITKGEVNMSKPGQ